jgi:hypothetical protein
MTNTDISEEIMQEILAAVRVTINAAIMDYHNVQVAHMQDQIAALQERLEQMERGQRDPLSLSQGEPVGVDSAETASGAIVRTQISPAAVRELVAPPQPRTVFGTREQVARQTEIAARCDSELLELFERDREERGYDRDRMMDFVLYNYYDRPALSFQIAKRDK